MNKVICTPGPFQRPSGTGVRVRELEKYLGEIETFKRSHEQVRSRLRTAKSINNPYLIFIVSEWGVGKTSIFDLVLREEAKQNYEDKIFPVMIPASTMINIVEDLVRRGKVWTNALKVITAIYEAIRESGTTVDEDWIQDILNEIKSKLNKLEEYDDIKQYFKDSYQIIRIILSKYGFKYIVIFIDEFEDIATRLREMYRRDERGELASKTVESIISGFVDITNNLIMELNTTPKHVFIITVTPNVWETIKRQTALREIIGRYREGRVAEIELEPLLRNERYMYLIGVLKYM